MPQLAIAGGAPVRSRPFTAWPQFDERERGRITEVLESRNWGGYPFPNALAETFGNRFAAHQDSR
ncbi:MAG TPA: DegT/DnrJ/EryC1/StrS family aminotransferase, partial [Blastocatellia bacterium]